MRRIPKPDYRIGQTVRFIKHPQGGDFIVADMTFDAGCKPPTWCYRLKRGETVSSIYYRERLLMVGEMYDEAKEPSRPTN